MTKNGTKLQIPFINCQPLIPGQQVFWFKGNRLLNYVGTDQVLSGDTNGQVEKDSTHFVFNTKSSFNGTYHCYGKNMHRTFDISYCKIKPLERSQYCWVFPKIDSTLAPCSGCPFFQSLNPLDIQVNLDDSLEIHLEYF